MEDRAAGWYAAHGYEVVDRNWRCADGEVDLVLVRPRDRVVVFCEVKARRTARFGTAADAVGPAKQARVRRVASRWLEASERRYRGVRFDVAVWDGGRFAVLEAAF